MNSHSPFQAPALDLAVRVGCELIYDATADTPALVTLKPRHDALRSIRQESFHFDPQLTATEFEDDHFNIVYRLVLRPGRNALRYEAIVMVPSLREDFAWLDHPIVEPSICRPAMSAATCRISGIRTRVPRTIFMLTAKSISAAVASL